MKVVIRKVEYDDAGRVVKEVVIEAGKTNKSTATKELLRVMKEISEKGGE